MYADCYTDWQKPRMQAQDVEGHAAAVAKAVILQATETPQSVHPVSHLLAPAHNAVVDVEGHGAADRKAVLQPSWIAGNRRRPAALYT